jgi:hypothetical protein
MKRTAQIAQHIAVFSLLAFLFVVPHVSHAAGLVVCGQDSPLKPDGHQACGFPELMLLASNIIDFLIFIVAPIIFVCVILYGGTIILVSAGNPESMSTAKGMFMKALTGLVIAMIAWIGVKFILEKLEVVSSVFPVFY